MGASVDPLVTATHAVFIEHKGHRAPAAVVGLQYQHSSLVAHFHNITSTVMHIKPVRAGVVYKMGFLVHRQNRLSQNLRQQRFGLLRIG